MNGFKILFILLTLLNARRFVKSRDFWYLGLSLAFGLMVIRERLPQPVFITFLSGSLIWIVWLGAWRFIPKLNLRRMMGNPKLRVLTSEEREWRSGLGKNDSLDIEILEMLTGQRLSTPEAIAHLESQREVDRESAARNAEKEANEEAEHSIKRAIEDEEKDLMISAASSPLQIAQSANRTPTWLKLDLIEDVGEDDFYGAPVKCRIWTENPSSGASPILSVLSLASVIGFPPDETSGSSISKPGFWASATPEFKEMFRNRCLIDGVAVTDDGRERFDFPIEGETFVIMTKYLSWRTDLALDQDQQRVWVRISEMICEVWKRASSDEDGDRDLEFEDYQRIPAFLYPVSVDRLMPSTHPEAHFETIEEMYE
ncbi:MAG: hypothetical protein V4689_22765 [Verrucomicrobiota bacterium]